MNLKKFFVLSCALISCGLWQSSATAASLQALDRSKLPGMHDIHVNTIEIGCTDCHAIPDGASGRMALSFTVRPEHGNCDSCHEEAFDAGEFINICQVCHLSDSFEVSAFPTTHSTIGEFSHLMHVDPQGRVNSKTGQREDCVFCHPVGDTTARAPLPSHPECAACHSDAKGQHPLISAKGDSQQCLACHKIQKLDQAIRLKGMNEMTPVGMLPTGMMARAQTAHPAPMMGGGGYEKGHGRGSWDDVVPFPHSSHVREKDGTAINCIVCHDAVTHKSEGGGGYADLPNMADCAVCHEAASRVGKENVIENCEVCHTRISERTLPGHNQELTAIAHNPGFKVNHEVLAREEDAYCSYCHNLQRVSGNSCADCHSVMKPQTHMAARFDETTHGRLAAMDREQCAVCHESDFCVRCHNIPPRSHAPLPLFAGGGLHRNLAALNLRSCFACHTFEGTCRECHAREIRSPG